MPRRIAMKRIALVLSLFGSICCAGERPTMKIPSPEETQVQDLLQRICNAVDNEDAQAYLACLTKEMGSRVKKDIAVRFTQHDMSMELSKITITQASESSVEFVASYTVYEDATPSTIVSSVVAKRIGDSLLLSKEEILSKTSSRPRDAIENVALMGPLRQFPANPCANGQCPLPPQKGPKDGGRIFPEGLSMFNDEHGNPDPNGIMWLDPKKILALYPDKYGVPPCMRAKLAQEAGLK
jgi:hypothetical protein